MASERFLMSSDAPTLIGTVRSAYHLVTTRQATRAHLQHHTTAMARGSVKSTPALASRSSSKRAAPERQTPSRQSKRAKATPAKYVEADSDEAPEDPQDAKASDFEADSSKDISSEPESEGASDDDDDDVPKKKAYRGRPAQRSLPPHKKQASDKELWKSGADLPHGTQLIMKKPKARAAGDTPYTDDTIHPNTMLFLKDLAANNERQWLKCRPPFTYGISPTPS